MTMRRRGWLAVCAALLLLAACNEEQPPAAVLRSVTLPEKSVVIPENGSVQFAFIVDEPGYQFDLKEEVVLYMATGPKAYPSEVSLVEVLPGTEEGHYIAVIADNGIRNDYVLSLLIGIRTFGGTFLFSEPFACKGEMGGIEVLAPDTGLPVIYVDTEGGAAIVSKENFVKATLSLREPGSRERSEPLSCSIRGRGNTTWSWPKKPYLIKLDSKASLLGMPAHKRWVLLANFMDRTMMRNLVAMRVSSMTSLDWTPRCRSVELVLNGKIVGNYLLIEQVRVDKNRVPVGDDGWLIESDFHYDNEVQWIDPHGRCVQMSGGIPFGIKNPDPDDITAEQVAEIKKYISDTAEALYGDAFADPLKGYARFIDVDSFVDYWIVFEVMGNHELGNPGSVFYHRKAGSRLKAGPCWDFDWGVLSYNANPAAKTGLLNRDACWYRRLFDDPAFRSRVKTRYQELLPQLQTVPAYIDSLETVLDASATLNFSKWNPAQDASMNGGSIINGDENLSFHSAVARLKSIYQERLTVIQANL